ncbi:MAG: flavodoxin family protein [Patescibacteria group bacterium]|nr:flavodoxin family protein [Patescibacteria group bacterium]
MKILIIYGTYSSGTLMVAEAARDMLTESGHTVTMLRVDSVQGQDIIDHELIIMGSPSWKVFGKQGMPHEWYYGMMERLKGQTFNRKFAVFGLGDESYALVCDSVNHLKGFVQELGGTLIGEPLKIEGFFFNKEQRLRELRDWLPTITS